MMDPVALIFILVAAGVALLVGELLLPTYGLLGLLGLLCFGGVMVVGFTINRWLGLTIFLGSVIASPFLITFAVNMWSKSYVGRKVILPPVEGTRGVAPVGLGELGLAVTDMRPMGECDFGEQRLEAISERGIIRHGEKVKVIGVVNGRAVVRPVTEPAPTATT
jgi:membrane-bound ClpP family serine protease